MNQNNMIAQLLGSVRGKLISALIVIALILDIVAEGITIVTGYYNMKIAGVQLEAKTARTTEDNYKSCAQIEAEELAKQAHGEPADLKPSRPTCPYADCPTEWGSYRINVANWCHRHDGR